VEIWESKRNLKKGKGEIKDYLNPEYDYETKQWVMGNHRKI